MKKRKKIKRILMDYMIITIASIVYGLGTSLFSDPNNLAPGGFTGVAIAMNRLAPIGTGTWFMLMNIPVLLLGVWKFGFRFIISTLYAKGVCATAQAGRSARRAKPARSRSAPIQDRPRRETRRNSSTRRPHRAARGRMRFRHI